MNAAEHATHTHTPETCRRYLGELSDYVEGTLSEELCRELEAHMLECENCRVVVNTFAKTISLYRQMPAPEMPNAVKERLYKVLDIHSYSPASEDDPGQV